MNNQTTNLNNSEADLFKRNNSDFSIESFNQHKDALLKGSPTLMKEIKKNKSTFPVHAFPKSIQEIIKETNDKLKFPIDFIGSSILFTSSIAFGNVYNVQVKKEWVENAVLYIAIIGSPGSNKSHPLTWAMKPIYDKQKEFYRQYKEDVQVTKGSESEPPFLRKLIVSDVTPESLATIISRNEKGVGVYVDELYGWLKSFNRYSGGNEEEFWLSNWSGKPLIIDRKSSESIYVYKPNISVCGTIQTGILDKLISGNKGVNGFIDRILMVAPEGLKKESLNNLNLDQGIVDRWIRIINKLVETPLAIDDLGEPEPQIIHFSSSAFQILKDWTDLNTALINKTEEDELKGIYTKIEAYCIRFSLIMYVLNSTCNLNKIESIDDVSVEGAIELAEYFREMAKRVHYKIRNASPLDKLPSSQRKWYVALAESFKTRDAVALAKSMLNQSESTTKRLLQQKALFQKVSQGNYEKLL